MRHLLLATLVACGDSGDGGADTRPPPETGAVTLTIRERGVPRADVRVYFQNADSSLVASTMTDRDGVASAEMASGGFVTAIAPLPLQRPEGPFAVPTLIRSFSNVQIGDALVISDSLESLPSVAMTVVLDEVQAATRYAIFECGGIRNLFNTSSQGGRITGSVDLLMCSATPEVSLLAISDTSGLVSVIRKSVTLSDLGTLDFTADTYVSPEDVRFDYTALPASIRLVAVQSRTLTEAGVHYELSESTTVTGGTATQASKRPAIANTTQVTDSRMATTIGAHGVVEWGPAQTTYTLSAGALLLSSLTAEPTYESNSVRWTLDGAGRSPNVVVAGTAFRGRDPTAELIDTWLWELVATGDNTTQTVSYPTLPDDPGFDPATGRARVLLANTAEPDAARTRVFVHARPGGYNGFPDVNSLIAGATGQITYHTSY